MPYDLVCGARKKDGSPCGATPQRESEMCFWHDPEQADEAAEARRLGGLRRRREKIVQGEYEIEALDDVSNIRRLLEVAALDALRLENSVARSRVLISAVQAALKLLEVEDFEDRIRLLETTVGGRRHNDS